MYAHRYYDLLLFTKDQDTAMESISNLEDNFSVSSEGENDCSLVFNDVPNKNMNDNDETIDVDTSKEQQSVRIIYLNKYLLYYDAFYNSNKTILILILT